MGDRGFSREKPELREVLDTECRKPQTVAVVGASGFLGCNVALSLTRAGYSVQGFVRRESPCLAEAGVRVVICADHENLHTAVADSRPDVVINMTNFFTRSNDLYATRALIDVNLSVISALGWACSRAMIPLLHVGTYETFPDVRNGQSGTSAYRFFRELAVRQIQWMVDAWGLRARELRLFDTYGPGDKRGKVVEILLRAAQSGEVLDVAPGFQSLNLVHVADVSTCIEAMLPVASITGSNSLHDLSPYWCVPTTSISMRALVSTIERQTGRKIRANWGARPYREGDLFSHLPDLESPPGWKAQVSLTTGIMQCWKSLLSQG